MRAGLRFCFWLWVSNNLDMAIQEVQDTGQLENQHI
jgi:hypothetical protein